MRKGLSGKLLRKSPAGRGSLRRQNDAVCARARRTFIPLWGGDFRPHTQVPRPVFPPHFDILTFRRFDVFFPHPVTPSSLLAQRLSAALRVSTSPLRARRDVVDARAFLTFLEKPADFWWVRKGLTGRLLRQSPAERGSRKGQKVVICARARRTFVP